MKRRIRTSILDSFLECTVDAVNAPNKMPSWWRENHLFPVKDMGGNSGGIMKQNLPFSCHCSLIQAKQLKVVENKSYVMFTV